MSGSPIVDGFLERNPEFKREDLFKQIHRTVVERGVQMGWSRTDEPIRRAVVEAFDRYEEYKLEQKVRLPSVFLGLILAEKAWDIEPKPEPKPSMPELFEL